MSYTPSTYGDEIGDVYDLLYESVDPAAIPTLSELAGGGSVLELGIGTGRLALPLAAQGLRISGIDASLKMIEKLRAKPGGSDIAITVGDFSSVVLEDRFDLVFIAFNTFFALDTAEDQLRCFRRVATMLNSRGVFAMEAFVPDLGRFDRGQRFSVFRVEANHVWLEASTHDRLHQVVNSQLVRLSNQGTRLYPIRIRYAWPTELDRMAELAGLRLRHRWGGWKQQPFHSESLTHVSVYEHAGIAATGGRSEVRNA
jgi:SAM-dependent methyltransferase